MANQELGKGVWHDPVNSGYIGLDLTADIPAQEKRTYNGIALYPKDEYHCSLVAVRKYVEPAEEPSIADAVKDYLREHDLHFAGLGEERYLCRKDDRMTMVAPVRIAGIEAFIAFIQKLIPGYVPPFPHVTLLKSETAEHGISINSVEDLRGYCEELTETSAYGMQYHPDNATVIARAKAVSDEKWNTLPVIMLAQWTPLHAHRETVFRRHVDRVVRGGLEPDGKPTKLWKDRDGELYIVDGHVHAAIYHELDRPMPVRVMDEDSLSELGEDYNGQ